MDRLQFVNSINFGQDCNFVKAAIEYFDHEMLLYNLIGKCNGIHIVGDTKSPQELFFSVNFRTSEEAIEMVNGLLSNGNQVSIYSKTFNMIINRSIQDTKTIEITLQKLN